MHNLLDLIRFQTTSNQFTLYGRIIRLQEGKHELYEQRSYDKSLAQTELRPEKLEQL